MLAQRQNYRHDLQTIPLCCQAGGNRLAGAPSWAPGFTLPAHLDGTLRGDFGFDPLNLGADEGEGTPARLPSDHMTYHLIAQAEELGPAAACVHAEARSVLRFLQPTWCCTPTTQRQPWHNLNCDSITCGAVPLLKHVSTL